MISIWRRNRDGLKPAGLHQVRAANFVLFMLFGMASPAVLPGCAWVRAQAQHQSDECEKLCAQAEAAKEAGRIDRADELLTAALKKSPRDMEVQRQLADSLWDVGRQHESLSLLAQLAEEHPRDVRLSTTLAERLAELERFDDALDRLQTALAADPLAAAPLELKAKLELQQGDSDAALATYQRLYQQDESQVGALLQMGAIHLQRGQPERAAPLFRSILTHPRATDSQRREAHWRLGVTYAQSRRWSDAAVELARVAPQREMSADDWHAVAYAQYRSGEMAAASSSLNHALGLEPGHRVSLKLSDVMLEEIAKHSDGPSDLVPTVFERIAAPPASTPR